MRCPTPDAATLDLDRVDYMTGPAGSLTIHNCRTVHGSPPNQSDTGRPLLLYAYSSADAFPYTYNPIMSSYYGAIVRGKTARYAHHDPRPCQIPQTGQADIARSSRRSKTRRMRRRPECRTPPPLTSVPGATPA